jgi:hypothetical protein
VAPARGVGPVSQQYAGRYDAGQSWAEGDVCPLAEADECTGRLREIECPRCGGEWQGREVDGGFYRFEACTRCDYGSVFVCDSCNWSS